MLMKLMESDDDAKRFVAVFGKIDFEFCRYFRNFWEKSDIKTSKILENLDF